MKLGTWLLAAPIGLAAIAITLAACGGGAKSSTGTNSASATSSAAASSSAAAPAGAGNFLQDAQVQQCLAAAGIAVPTPTGTRTGARPTGSFTGQRPTGAPTGGPTGGVPDGGPGGGGFFGADSALTQQIQDALKACGIALPTGGNRGPATNPTASATPSS